MPIPFVNTLAVIGAALLTSASGAVTTSPTSAGLMPPNSNLEVRNSEYNQQQSSQRPASTKSQDSVINAKADVARTQGKETARVWVIEISDMECPYCKEWNQNTYPKLYEEFIKTGKVKFAYINFPLSMHKHARLAAQTAMCSAVQGKFWEVKKAIFDSQEKWSALSDANSFMENLAKGAGVDTKDWKSCINSPAINSLIESDIARAKRQNVKSTPSIIVGGRLISGSVPMDDLRKMINAALAEKK